MKVIETEYRGFRFRSRLEARWAVFMDAMHVRYEYEKEAYDLDGLFYLPDFWLPDIEKFLETKPVCPSDEEFEKARRLSDFTNHIVLIMIGQPSCPSFHNAWYGSESCAIFISPKTPSQCGGVDYHYIWCECPHCHKCDLQFDGRADRIDCDCPGSEHGDKGYNFDSERLIHAYNLARGYRFEPNAQNTT